MKNLQGKDNRFSENDLEADTQRLLQQLRQRKADRQLQLDTVEENQDKLPVVILEEDRLLAHDIYLFRYAPRADQWQFTGLYFDGVFRKLDEFGFKKRYNVNGQVLFIREQNNRISETISARMRDEVKAYIDANTHPIGTDEYSVTYAARSEKHRRSSSSLYNDIALIGLQTHERPILQDSTDTCYVPYRNGLVVVNNEGIRLESYSALGDTCIWQGQTIDRDFVASARTKCHFADFIANVSNHEPDRQRAFRTALGYVIHSYNQKSAGQAIICCDEELTDRNKPQGGTGKGVWVNAIRQIRPCALIDGKKYDPDNRFGHQAINYDTRFVWLDDVKSNFNFERFFSILTAGWTIEKKNGQEFSIPYEYGPKLIICTNIAPNTEGSSNARRQFILEFSDFYKKRLQSGHDAKPIQDVHGCEFYTNDWDTDEWAQFDRFMIECTYEYMRHGLVGYKTHNVTQNRLLQTTGEEFVTWADTYEEKGLQPNVIYRGPELCQAFRTFAGLSEKACSSRGFTEKIKEYASSKGWKYERGSSNNNPTFRLYQTAPSLSFD